ncbi:hypothetical protein [Paractinoplanes toevensis]|nr:hypothetical protein [Actinoplanes toevensis]
MGSVLDQIMDWVVDALLTCLDSLFALITGALLKTPEVTALPQVQALTGRSIWIVDVAFVLVFTAAGALTMFAGGDEKARYTAKDLIPRGVVGFVAAHFSQLFCSKMIELANAVTAAVTSDDINQQGAVAAMQAHIKAAREPTAALLFAVLIVLIIVLLASTTFSMISRFTLLLIMTAVAPMALACHALPQTDSIARLWWRGYAGALAVPTAQGFLLYAGQWMLLDPRHLMPAFGLPIDPGSIMNLLVVVVLLFYTVRIPGLMSRWVMSGGRQTNVLAMIARVAVVQQITRAVPGVGRLVRGR